MNMPRLGPLSLGSTTDTGMGDKQEYPEQQSAQTKHLLQLLAQPNSEKLSTQPANQKLSMQPNNKKLFTQPTTKKLSTQLNNKKLSSKAATVQMSAQPFIKQP